MNISGKVVGFQDRAETITNVIIQKTRKGKPYTVCFISFGDTCLKVREELLKGDFVKFTFIVRSKEYKEKYYTDLIITSFEVVRRKESKTQRISQTSIVDLETGEIIESQNEPPF
tara:strand:+ start:5839 stop:6183 length:345 start_codon:yes stop_codon:yes gene_type:complete